MVLGLKMAGRLSTSLVLPLPRKGFRVGDEDENAFPFCCHSSKFVSSPPFVFFFWISRELLGGQEKQAVRVSLAINALMETFIFSLFGEISVK